MAMSRTEIVARSDAKKGMQAKTYKLPTTVVAEIEQLSRELSIPQNQIIIQAVAQFKQAKK